jgi:endoglucanase
MRAAVLLSLVSSLAFAAACGSSSSGTHAASPEGGADGSTSFDSGGSPSDGGGPGDTSTANDTGAGGMDAGMDAGAAGLHVEGNHLVFQGKTTRLLGVDHSGSEYSCISSGGYGIFEGPDPDTMSTAILAWGHVNAIRIPLNEDCWLGINGVNAMYSGTTYQTAVTAYANKLHAHGIFTIVDLHWNAPGTVPATTQQPMADAEHAVDFWTSVATAFKGDGMTVFDVYNEPYISTSNAQTSDPWACWLDGCTITQGAGGVTGSWPSAGMQTLVNAIRKTGATNVLMLGGLAYSDDLSGWLAHVPTDPLKQLAASFHLYNFNTCITQSCWDANAGAIAKQYPVVTGEMGENDCGHAFIDTYMPWADTNGVSYLGWTWNVWDCSSGPALITDYDGGATGFGAGLRAHLMVTSP